MLDKAEIYQFELPLIQTIKMFGKTFNTRKGLLLYLYDKKGNIGVGECMPIYGLNPETFEEAKSDLIQKIDSYKFKSTIKSVEYALDSAIFQLNHNFKSKYINLFENGIFTVDVQALISSNLNDLDSQLKYISDNEFKRVKLKIGDRHIEDDISLINKIISKSNNNFKLRLDANKKLTLINAIKLVDSIDKSKVEYIEEPLINNQELNRFYQQTKVNIALDESLYEVLHINQYDKYDGVSTYIIKPNIWGSLGKIYTLLILAQRNNINAVFSSPFESGFGIYWQSIINKLFSNSSISMGLDTYKYLDDDILNEKLNYRKNQLIIKETSSIPSLINKDKLSLIYEHSFPEDI